MAAGAVVRRAWSPLPAAVSHDDQTAHGQAYADHSSGDQGLSQLVGGR